MPENILTIDLKNTRPIELTDFTNSLASLADEYKKTVARSDSELSDDIRLYIKEIRTGSIIAQLVEMMPYAMPFMGDANTLIEFCKTLQVSIAWLKGGVGAKPSMKKHTYENIVKLVEPVAKDNGAVISIQNTEVNAPINIVINNMEANGIQNRARRELDQMKEPVGGFKDNMVIRWYQGRNDPKSKTGDRAIIEAIYPYSVKTIFGNESIKSKMLLGDENPFKFIYLADIQVQTIGDKPVLYTILSVKENLGPLAGIIADGDPTLL